MAIGKLFTWVDVHEVVQQFFYNDENQKWLQNISFSAYWNGLTVEYAAVEADKFPKNEGSIRAKLADIFLLRYDSTSDRIQLENDKFLSVIFEQVAQEDIHRVSFKPSIAKSGFISRFQEESFLKERKQEKPPYFFAFHSFKGGVGRTLHAIALAVELSKKHKVLLVDADFEAPGITWLVENAQFSFSDLLAIIHGSQNIDEIKSYCKYITATSASKKKLYILPAFRELKNEKLPVLDIKPEHIFQFSSKPFILTRALEIVAEELKVDYVILDLRAGVSELSSGWFFDPKINKVVVSTLSSQSMLGTELMFRILKQFSERHGIINAYPPALIFSQIPTEAKAALEANWVSLYLDNGPLTEIREQYCEAFLPKEHLNDDLFTSDDIKGEYLESLTLFTGEIESLRSLPADIDAVVNLIKESQLELSLRKIVSFFHAEAEITLHKNVAADRFALKELSEKMIYAEQETDDQSFLVTKAINNIVRATLTDLPVLVIVGAKGAGKSFLFNKLNASGTIHNFKRLANQQIKHNNLLVEDIIAVTYSDTNKPNSKHKIWQEQIKPDIELSLKRDFTQSEWREKWIDYMAWATGYNVGTSKVGLAFIRSLEERGKKILCLFDGLENLFDEFILQTSHRTAIVSLLIDVPNWLESQPQKHLGAVIFIRKDIVLSVIKQNVSHFLAKYSDFELKWNTDEALRLIYWILIKARSDKKQNFEFEKMSIEEILSELKYLWGSKMGKDNSKEAYAHNWVISTLANLNKEVQSRDVVRFLSVASENALNGIHNASFNDRLLSPQNIRESIGVVGKEKIKEVKDENPPLKIIIELLEKNKSNLKFPCAPEDLLGVLTNDEIQLLEANGVIKMYQGEYYMAEIFRQGLGFLYSRKARPKSLFI